MSSTTTTSSAATATTIPATILPPPPSQTSDSGHEPSLFQTAGSPALVLAFLAVGILAGGLVSVLFFRRFALMRLMRQRQAAALAAGDGMDWRRRAPRSRELMGPKPELWDIECGRISEKTVQGRWKHIVPLSVSYTRPLHPSAHVMTVPEQPSRRKVFVSRLGTAGRWVRGLASLPSEQPQHAEITACLHVAVAITMPGENIEGRPEPERTGEVPVYALGLTDITYEADAIDTLISTQPASTNL